MNKWVAGAAVHQNRQQESHKNLPETFKRKDVSAVSIPEVLCGLIFLLIREDILL